MVAPRNGLSPAAIMAMLGVTLRVMLGRIPAVGHFLATPDGLWQAIGASLLLTVLVSLYPGLMATPTLFFTSIIVQLIGVLLLLLMFHRLLTRLGCGNKFLPFAVPFLWIENLQQLLGGIVQNLLVMTGDQTVLILILPLAIWTIYWLWRLGRDIIGKGGGVAAGLVMLSFMIDLGLLMVLQSRVGGAG